jgi:DNA-binding NtrC family response regulator
MPGATDTYASPAPRAGTRRPDWVLAVALECERLSAAPLRLPLARMAEIEIGRGALRAVRRAGDRLRLDLDDRRASGVHARLVRSGAGWILGDAGSKNGTRLNGVSVESAEVVDGDVIECGGTFIVLRRAHGPVAEIDGWEGRPAGLRTLSPALESELGSVPRVALSRVPILVRGESGTGKEVLASAIHALSRRSGPLVAVNCGAIPATLVESELFGTRRGAFSGAEDRPGRVRAAEHGTLFLDEIAELPAVAQAALLRFLQEGEVQTLGVDRRTVVDVRVVAATNRHLESLMAEGSFRRDLYARLRGFALTLSPLRDRIEDLGLLVGALLARIEPDGAGRRLARNAARALFLHSWPYNIRELEQVLRAAVATAAGDEIRFEDLSFPRSKAGPEAEPMPPPQQQQQQVVSCERLVGLLEQHAGNASAVARDLATSRTQVRRLLARYGLTSDAFKKR